MEEGMFLFENIKPNKSFINDIFSFDVNKLDSISNLEVSKFVIALSQYLIYFKYELNKTRMYLRKEQHLLEASLTQMMTPEILKKYKTKKDARFNLVYNNAVLNSIQLKIDSFNDEVILLEGIDKTISELIAAYKRDLTRRENELYQEKHA